MALKHSKWATRNKSAPVSREAGGAVTVAFEYDLDAALAAGDILEVGVLPAGATVLDMVLDTDDLDAGATPTGAVDVGVVSGEVGAVDASRTCGNEFFAGSTLVQTGGVARMSKQAGFRVAATDKDRGIGVKVATAPATSATSGKVRLIVTYAN